MRIGIDATCWANGRGYGRFTREIVRALAEVAAGHELVCFLDDRAAASFELDARNVQTTIVTQGESPTTAASAGSYRSPADMLRFTRATAKARLDVFFSPSVYTFYPLPPGLPAVITIHDAIAERYPHLTLPTPRARLFWRLKVRLALSQATLVLTPSEFGADEIAAVHRVPRSRIRVALEAPAPAYRPSESAADIRAVAAQIGLPDGARWLTYVGGFNPHKNLDVLVRAHARVASRLPAPLHLVLVGAEHGDGFHGNVAAIREAIHTAGTGHLVHWTGYLSDDAIRQLHSGAVALLLPSENEGFGLPAVEAAACGSPVIATTRSPLPLLLDGGGLFVTPGDEAGLAAAIESLATDAALAARLGSRARERALELTWSRAAQAAFGALQEAAA